MTTNDSQILDIDPQQHVAHIDGLAYENAALSFAGVALTEVAAQFGTPTYVYNADAILAKYHAYDDSFASIAHQVCFAVKANSNIAVLQLLAQAGAGFDIVTGGELARVIKAGGEPSKIVFSGLGKTVSPDQSLQPVAGVDAKALGGTGLAGGIAGAESEFEQGGAWHHGVAEDEAGHSAVKGAEVIEGDDCDDDGIGHGGRLLCTRIPMIRGGNRKPKGHVAAWPSLIRGRWTRHPRVPAPALPSPVCRCSRAARAVSAGYD